MLHPPTSDPAGWLAELREWQRLLDDGPFTASCPIALSQHALSLWYANRDAIAEALAQQHLPFDHSELLRVLEPFRGRLAASALPNGVDALVDDPMADPAYTPPSLDADQRGCFTAHLADAGVVRHLDGQLSGVITRANSWAEERDATTVNARVPLLSLGQEIIAEVDDERVVRELLRLWRSPVGALSELAGHGCALIDHPELAVRAVFASLGGDPADLRFRMASAFSTTLRARGYASTAGRTTTCFRTVALIAAGRAAELSGLEAHPHRAGSGGNDPPVRDRKGRLLYRGYLARSSPDAHRLFWWSGEEPEFVGIAGHDDAPPI